MYMTRAEMAKELTFCMQTINQRNEKIEELEARVQELEDELKKLKPSPDATLLDTIRHQMDQLPPPAPQPPAKPSTTMKIRERKTEIKMPKLPPSAPLTGEAEIIDRIKQNTAVQDVPPKKRGRPEKVDWLDSKRHAICNRCGNEFTHTKRTYIPQRCPDCETFVNKKCPVAEQARAPVDDNPFKSVDSAPWKEWEMRGKQCDTCVFGKPLPNPKDGTNGHECMEEKAHICKPGIQSNNYLAREAGIDI